MTLPLWQTEWEEVWDTRAQQAAQERPLRSLPSLPKMKGIADKERPWLRYKAFKWMIEHDYQKTVWNGFLRHPWRYTAHFVRSLLSSSFKRDGEFFLYNLSSVEAFKKLFNEKSLLIVGFSYCHKPFECPSGRFSPHCKADSGDLVCQQCFIGKCQQLLLSHNSELLIIPTIHYVGAALFEIIERHPDKQLLFVITACEMTLTMFGDWGKMVALRGIGVKLDGRVCNTIEAFALSEQGVKPGLTVVLPSAQQRMIDILLCWQQRQEQ